MHCFVRVRILILKYKERKMTEQVTVLQQEIAHLKAQLEMERLDAGNFDFALNNF